jgi:hypothetical protein
MDVRKSEKKNNHLSVDYRKINLSLNNKNNGLWSKIGKE